MKLSNEELYKNPPAGFQLPSKPETSSQEFPSLDSSKDMAEFWSNVSGKDMDDWENDNMNSSFMGKAVDFDDSEEEKVHVGHWFDRMKQKYGIDFVPMEQSPSDDELNVELDKSTTPEKTVEEQIHEIVESIVDEVDVDQNQDEREIGKKSNDEIFASFEKTMADIEKKNEKIEEQLAETANFLTEKTSLPQVPKQTEKTEKKAPSEFNMFWPKMIAQQTMDSVKKATTAVKRDISHASSSLFAKIRSPGWSRPSSPMPAKQSLRKPQSKITHIQLSSEPRTPEPTDNTPPSSLSSRKRRLKKKSGEELMKVRRIFTEQPFLGADGIKHFLTEEEQEIVSTSKQDAIPQELLDSLVQIQRIDYDYENSQRHFALADTFPGIALTFGSKNWLYIKAIYMSFCVHENPLVRLKMAQSIHEVAQNVGSKWVEKDLCKIFQQFAKDTNEIQQSLLKNMYEFVEAIPEKSRVIIASDLSDFNTFEFNNKWRLRYEFAQQITRLISLFKPDEINTYLVPFALTLSADKISEIRLCALEMLALILAKFISQESSKSLSDQFLNEVEQSFWKSKDWRRRQSFAIMMKILLEKELVSREMFCQTFDAKIFELSFEDIPNIRQYFCTIVDLIGRDRLEELDPNLHSHVFSRLHHLAASDSDLEVQMMARVSLGTMDKLRNEVDLSCRTIQSDSNVI